MDDFKSKSQRKRDAAGLQKIGVELVALSLAKLDALPLPDHLRRAIIDAKTLRSHGAIRRQAQLIGKFMRASAYDEIIAAYNDLQAEDSSKTAKFHEVETWRMRLIDDGKDALTAFVAAYHPEDVQQLRQLVKKAVDEKKAILTLETERPTGAMKALFRYLRPLIV